MTVLIRLVTLPRDNSSSLKISLVHARHSPGDERKEDCGDSNCQSPNRIHAGRHRCPLVRFGFGGLIMPAFGYRGAVLYDQFRNPQPAAALAPGVRDVEQRDPADYVAERAGTVSHQRSTASTRRTPGTSPRSRPSSGCRTAWRTSPACGRMRSSIRWADQNRLRPIRVEVRGTLARTPPS
jgi:hypothetical protein